MGGGKIEHALHFGANGALHQLERAAGVDLQGAVGIFGAVVFVQGGQVDDETDLIAGGVQGSRGFQIEVRQFASGQFRRRLLPWISGAKTDAKSCPGQEMLGQPSPDIAQAAGDQNDIAHCCLSAQS